ncbi:hypothetical protein D3C78_847810 [compost metagenome]
MIFDDHAAGVGVAHIQNQIDGDRRCAERVRNKFDFRDGDLLAQHGHQVEPVCLVLKAAHGLLQIAI